MKEVNLRSEKTEIILGQEMIRNQLFNFLANSRKRLDFCVSSLPNEPQPQDQSIIDALLQVKNRGIRPRMLTEVTLGNSRAALVGAEIIEIRHVDNLKGSFAVNDEEYLSSPTVGNFQTEYPVIFSNAKTIVGQHEYIFDTLWKNAQSIKDRIESLESGPGNPQLEIIRDTTRIKEIYLSQIDKA